MDFNNIYILISIASALLGAGFGFGVSVGRLQTKERCEMLRKASEEERQKETNRIECEFKNTVVRVHERIDKIFDKLTPNE